MSKLWITALLSVVAACSSSDEVESGDISTRGDFCRAAATVTCDLLVSCGGDAAQREACIEMATSGCQDELQGCSDYTEARAQDCLDGMMAGTCGSLGQEWLGASATCDFECM